VNPLDRNRLLEALNENKHIKGFEAQLKRKDGTPFWAAITAQMFPEQDYIEGVIYDITIHKQLTKAERKVLDFIMQGKSNKEIAKELGRSVRTIEDHRAHIMQKLGVDNLVDLAQKALNYFRQ
jgi:DNA-binding NarL/FixJ family response regulator